MISKLYNIYFIVALILYGCISAQNIDNQFYFNFQDGQINIEQALSKYIQFESISGSEREAGEFIKNLCEENGLFITQMGDTDGNYNISASMYSLSENLPNIIFLNHIDVVPPGDYHDWTHPPFSGDITENEIWGRGAFDNKGAAIMQLASIVEISREYENISAKYNITFLSVSCEETQCEGGVKYVVENHFEELNPVVIIGEGPPSLTKVLKSNPEATIFGISVAHKRALWLKLELENETSGHGAITPLRYSNKEMVLALKPLLKKKQKAIFNELNMGLLKDLGDLETGMTSLIFKHPRLFKFLIVPQLRKQPKLFALFSNTITLTNIESNNDVINIIPNKTTALLDCRLLPLESRDKFLRHVKKCLKNDSIKISVINTIPEFIPSDSDNIFYKNLKSVIAKNYPDCYVAKVFLPNFNDTNIFRSKGVPAFSVMPVKMEIEYLDFIHNNNERIPRNILIQGKNIYVEFLEKILD